MANKNNTSKNKNSTSKNSGKSAPKKQFFLIRWIKGLINYFVSAYSELKKVSWPTRKELFRGTWVVIVLVLLFTVICYGLDTLFGFLAEIFYNLV